MATTPPSWLALDERGRRRLLHQRRQAAQRCDEDIGKPLRIDGRYLVDHDVHYTLKLSETGSHMQIVSAIEPGAQVLDLGCSQGLLAKPLLEKGVRLVGVDARSPDGVVPERQPDAHATVSDRGATAT